MGALDSTEWELFLRKMIARNLRIFGAPDLVRNVCDVDFFCKPILGLSKLNYPGK